MTSTCEHKNLISLSFGFKLTFVPKWKKFSQRVPELLCSQEWARQMDARTDEQPETVMPPATARPSMEALKKKIKING